MRKGFVFTLLLFLILGLPHEADARRSKSNGKTKKVKTVGDLLKNIRNKNVRKRTAIPSRNYEKRGKTVNLRAVRPPRSTVFFSSGDKDEDTLEKYLDEEIKQLFNLTQKYKTSPNRGEIWLRLAERYVEKAQLIEFRLQRKFDSDLEKWENKKRRGRRPSLNLKTAQVYNRKAIRLYDAFLKAFPKDNKADQALFFLGYNYFELGNPKLGEKRYKELTKKHPRSPYVQESHFALGEYYFDSQKWKDARTHYRKVAKNKNARLYTFALYKMAWCEYRLGRPKVALILYENVIKDARSGGSSGSVAGTKKVNRVRLAKEALGELIPVYAEIKPYREAPRYFSRLLQTDNIRPVLDRLGFIYSYAGKRSAARYIFEKLIEQEPNAEKAFDYQYQIVSDYSAGGDQKVFKAELFEWIEKYSPDSAWARANSDNKEALEKAMTVREKTLRTYALKAHKIAQDSKAKSAEKKALDGYKLYLATFPESKNVSDMHFYFGELLFDMKQFAQASVHYIWVSDNDPKSKFAEQATLNALLALEQELPPEEELVKRSDNSLKEIPYRRAELRFQKAAEKYLKNHSRGKRAADVRFKLARLKYAHNELDNALKEFWSIVETYPDSEYATYSANLILDIYNLKKDYDGLVKAGDKLLKYPRLVDKGTGADIRNVVQRAEFKKAQDLEAQKNFNGSAKEYEAFYRKNPSSKLASTAIFNAGVNFERAGNVLAALSSYALVLKRNDSTARQAHEKAMRLSARLYEKTGQLERAAIEFEKFGNSYKRSEFRDESYLNAAIIWAALKRKKRAILNYNRYFNSTRKRDRVVTHYRIGEIHEQSGSLKSAYSYYKKYIESSPSDADLVMRAHIKLHRIAKKLNWSKNTKEWAEKTIGVQGRLARRGADTGKSEAAEAKFYLAEELYQQYKVISIPKNEKRAQAAILKKTKMLGDVNRELGKVVKYDDANYVVSAVALTAQANHNFVSTIQKAPVPSGLSADQVKQYKEAVDKKFAAEPRKVAISNYKLAIRRSKELNAYNDWVLKSYEGLQQLDPKTDGLMKESLTYSSKVDLMDIGGSKKYERFLTAIQTGSEAGAVTEASKILSENENDGRVLNGLAVFYLQNGRPEMGNIFLGKAQGSKSDKSALHNNMGIYWLQNEEENRAIEEFYKALSEDSNNASASANLGYILLKYQNYSQSKSYLEDAVSKLKSDAGTLNNYAVALRKSGKTSQAENYYQKAIEKKSSDVSIQLNYARLLAEDLKNKDKAIKLINKVKFIGGSKTTKEADELLRKVQQ